MQLPPNNMIILALIKEMSKIIGAGVTKRAGAVLSSEPGEAFLRYSPKMDFEYVLCFSFP